MKSLTVVHPDALIHQAPEHLQGQSVGLLTFYKIEPVTPETYFIIFQLLCPREWSSLVVYCCGLR